MFEVAKILKEAAIETIWPTRCAICDKQGDVVCRQCLSKIPFIDSNKTCKKCGEPYGALQCISCSPVLKMLPQEQRDSYQMNFDKCVSCTTLTEETGRIIALHKDAGEQSLAWVIAYFIACYVKQIPFNKNTFVTYIPSTEEALRRRGFDHCKNIAEAVAKMIGLRCVCVFNRPKSSDQRELGRKGRIINMQGMFTLMPEICIQKSDKLNAILIDDVLTTGATLDAASLALKNSNFNKVYCATFTRTF